MTAQRIRILAGARVRPSPALAALVVVVLASAAPAAELQQLDPAAYPRIVNGQNAGNAICLRAGFVVGTRRTLPGLLTWVKIAVPMDGFYEVVSRLCPTIGVEELAGAAVRFVLAKRKAKTALVPNEAIPDYLKQPWSRDEQLR